MIKFGLTNLAVWIMVAHTTASLSVLLACPWTTYPAIELIGLTTQRNKCWSRIFSGEISPVKEEEDDLLAAFEPLPPRPDIDSTQDHFAEDSNIHVKATTATTY